jgi:hypothetical protein
MLETWLLQQCWPMGYESYDWRKKGEMKARIAHAIQMVSNWPSAPAPGNPGTTVAPHAAMGGNDKAAWTGDPNPPFVFPPLSGPLTMPAQQNNTALPWPQPPTQVQHDAVDSSRTARQFPQPSHFRSISHAPNPDFDDWELIPSPRTRSRQQHNIPHPMPQLQPPVEHFDRSISNMLHTQHGPVVPGGVFPKRNENPEASSRRKRAKKRASNRKRDRISKLFRGGYNSADGGSESDDSDDGRDRSSHLLHPLDLNRRFLPPGGQQPFHRRPTPHPPSWNIYARQAMPHSQTFAPPHNESPPRRPSPHEIMQAQEMTKRHRHRPPSLDLSDTEVVSNSLGLLNFRQ